MPDSALDSPADTALASGAFPPQANLGLFPDPAPVLAAAGGSELADPARESYPPPKRPPGAVGGSDEYDLRNACSWLVLVLSYHGKLTRKRLERPEYGLTADWIEDAFSRIGTYVSEELEADEDAADDVSEQAVIKQFSEHVGAVFDLTVRPWLEALRTRAVCDSRGCLVLHIDDRLRNGDAPVLPRRFFEELEDGQTVVISASPLLHAFNLPQPLSIRPAVMLVKAMDDLEWAQPTYYSLGRPRSEGRDYTKGRWVRSHRCGNDLCINEDDLVWDPQWLDALRRSCNQDAPNWSCSCLGADADLLKNTCIA